MSFSKKLLVAFDPKKPDSQITDFLIPWNRGVGSVFLGLKSGKESALGMMVYTGVAINENDLFAKLVDSGNAIGNVEETLAMLRAYLLRLQSFKIGNVVQIDSTNQASGREVELALVANTPTGVKISST